MWRQISFLILHFTMMTIAAITIVCDPESLGRREHQLRCLNLFCEMHHASCYGAEKFWRTRPQNITLILTWRSTDLQESGWIIGTDMYLLLHIFPALIRCFRIVRRDSEISGRCTTAIGPIATPIQRDGWPSPRMISTSHDWGHMCRHDGSITT